jgi:hypothetical protein
VLPGDAARFGLVASVKASGFDADSFATKRRARELVADGLTRLEDRLELEAIDAGGYGRGLRRAELTRQRETIRGVRRRLEQELWP